MSVLLINEGECDVSHSKSVNPSAASGPVWFHHGFCSFWWRGYAYLCRLPSDLGQGIGILSTYKSSAEGQARILVGLAAENDITKDEYRKGQSLYAEAKAGFDGWIDQLIFEVQSGKTELLSPQYESIQMEAKVKGDAFTQYVQKQFLGNPRGEVGDVLKSVFASINDVAKSVVNGFSNVSPTEQPEVIKKLEGYKWTEFHTIEQRLQ